MRRAWLLRIPLAHSAHHDAVGKQEASRAKQPHSEEQEASPPGAETPSPDTPTYANMCSRDVAGVTLRSLSPRAQDDHPLGGRRAAADQARRRARGLPDRP